MKTIIHILAILFLCSAAYSQTNESETQNSSTSSVSKFDEKFALSVEYKNPSIQYDLEYLIDENSTTTPIEYRKEEAEYFTFSASYLDYSLSFSLDLNDIKDVSDFKFSKYSRKYWIDLNYQNYKGFKIDNPSDFGMSAGDPGIEQSSLEIINYNANYVHIFSDDFSIAAAMEQTERQNTWDWTFLLGASTGKYEIRSNKSMLPPSEEPLFVDYPGYKGGEYYYIAVLPGLGITIPIYKFFISYSALVGGGYAYEISHTSDGEIKGNTSMYKFISKGSIGYNGDNYFARFTITLDQTEVNLFTYDTADPKVTLVTGSLAAGMRF